MRASAGDSQAGDSQAGDSQAGHSQDADDLLAVAHRACARFAKEHGGSWALVRRAEDRDVRLAGTGDWPVPASLDQPLDEHEAFVLCGPVQVDLAPLCAALEAERAAEAASRAAAALPRDGENAPSTGLGNHETWARAVTAEEERCARLAHPAVVLLLGAATPTGRADPDDDQRRARRVAAALRRSLRTSDVVCELAEGRYGVLAVECTPGRAGEVGERLVAALLDVGVGAVVGAASREPEGGLAEALRLAGAQLEQARGRQRILRL